MTGSPRERDNIGARLKEIEADILSGALDEPTQRPSDYDLWVDARLQDGSDQTWFAGQSLFAVATFCRLLGQALSDDPTSVDDSGRATFLAAGFDVAQQGESAIRKALDGLAAKANGHLDEPNKAFGPLYPALNRDYMKEDGFAPFRRILRDCILDNWPIAAGETVLGDLLEERRLHSLRTAALEAGVGTRVIEPFLIECGALRPDDDRPDSRRLFDARAHAGLLAEIPTLVGINEMRRAMGASRREFAALVNDGLILPRTRSAKVKNIWRVSDGLALVSELVDKAVVVGDDDEWEPLLQAKRRCGIGFSTIIAGIRDGRVSVGQRSSACGFGGIVVLATEVEKLANKAQKDATQPESPGIISAAEFGRSVGLRDHGGFIALVEAGHASATLVTNTKTGRQQYRLGNDDITEFHKRFVTLRTLAEETGLHRNTLLSLLSGSRVTQFAPGGRSFGSIYLRDEASRAIR